MLLRLATPGATVTVKNLVELHVGAVFRQRYRVVRKIKAGGQGAVYEVKDESTNRPRALKVLHPNLVDDPDMRARFALEARITGDIESDHLVRISDVGIDEASGSPFMVMDLLRGEDLQGTIGSRGALPPAEVLEYLMQTARVLEKTHAANIVHRDLKPDNLFVTRRDDGSPCIKILDFGIAKIVAQANAKKTRALGTPLYMAPEQVRGDPQISLRADVYSLAHVAYALLTGAPYWADEAQVDPTLVNLLMRIMAGAQESAVTRALRRNVHLPPAFDAWFHRATAVLPDQRFEGALALVNALGQILPPTNVAAAPPQAPAAHAFAMQTTQAVGAYPNYPQAGQTSSVPAGGGAWGPTAQQMPYATTAAVPQQPMAQPAAPQKPALPLVAILAGAGILGLLFIVILAVVLTSSSKPPPVAAGGCGAALACTPTNVSDPTHADPLALLDTAKSLAKQVDSSAKLLSLTASYSQSDGTTNLENNQAIVYMFIDSKQQPIAVSVVKTLISASRVPSNAAIGSPVSDPKCAPKKVVAIAAKDGVSAAPTVSIHYRQDPSMSEPGWIVFGTGTATNVDDKECK